MKKTKTRKARNIHDWIFTKVKNLWEVQHYTLFDGWVNCWTEDDKPWRFKSRRAAKMELDDYVAEVQDAVDRGDMVDPVNLEDYRIVRVKAGIKKIK